MNRCWSSLAVQNPLLLAVALGCNSTGVGNPRVTSVSLAIVADDEPAVVVSDAADAGVMADSTLPRASLRHAVFVLGSVRWLPCDAQQDAIVAAGPFLVDLVTGETRPALPDVNVPTGGLCGFDAPLTPARDSAELSGRSLFFSGLRADGIPFLLFANMEATLRVRAANNETWGERGDAREPLALLWAMQPRRWASAMELDSAQDSTWANAERIIPIDVNRNPILYAAIQARLSARSSVFLDRDRDSFLDEDERASAPVGTGSADTSP